MSNKRKGYLRILVPAGLILFCLGMVWLVDQVFNGVFKEWFYSLFYTVDGEIGFIYKTWPEIKQFFVICFIVLMAVIALLMSLSYFLALKRSKKEISQITDAMQAYMTSDSDDLALPKRYSEIEMQLVKLKSVTQRQQQLVQMEMQRKSDLITYLAHDLKTPLASVIGYLSLLDEAPDMPAEKKAKYTGIALEKAYRLEELINEFFDITRFNMQSMVLNKGKIKLEFMLQQMADEFYPMLAPQGKQVSIHASSDLIMVGDADKLARVFNNILKNAIAYSYENSVIDITATRQGQHVCITFTNIGDPIPAQKLDTIFEKFYRLDSARSTNTGGAGLGLAIAREIVIAHDGTISVESTLEHTVFSVRLPL